MVERPVHSERMREFAARQGWTLVQEFTDPRHLGREILDQRVKDLEANPEAGDSWDIVQERLRRALDRKPWIG